MNLLGIWAAAPFGTSGIPLKNEAPEPIGSVFRIRMWMDTPQERRFLPLAVVAMAHSWEHKCATHSLSGYTSQSDVAVSRRYFFNI